jgi:hypothetical protein
MEGWGVGTVRREVGVGVGPTVVPFVGPRVRSLRAVWLPRLCSSAWPA